jgi:hypothetical protein
MKLGRRGQATILKGVYNLNPTQMVMKLGGELQRSANARGAGDIKTKRDNINKPAVAKGK